jgi:hypothetical protein
MARRGGGEEVDREIVFAVAGKILSLVALVLPVNCRFNDLSWTYPAAADAIPAGKPRSAPVPVKYRIQSIICGLRAEFKDAAIC